jgi:pilus assembly protein Flp/PilA
MWTCRGVQSPVWEPTENVRRSWRYRMSMKMLCQLRCLRTGRGGVLRTLRNLVDDASGASALEYGLVVGLVALALIAGMGFAGNVLSNVYTYIATTIENVLTGG